MRVALVIVSVLVATILATCVSNDTELIGNSILLVFNPSELVQKSVSDAIEKNKKDTDASKSLEDRFEERINKLRTNFLKSFEIIFVLFVLSLVFACIFVAFYPLSDRWLNSLQIISAFLILFALLSYLGWSIQTWGGDSLPEQLDSYLFRMFNSVAIFLLFTVYFYNHVKPKSDCSNESICQKFIAYSLKLLTSLKVIWGKVVVFFNAKNKR